MNQRLTLVAIVILTAFTGCNADPGSRREIALLRAELVDLENEYYALKSRCGDAGEEMSADALCDESGTVISGDESWPDDSYPANGSRLRVPDSSPASDPSFQSPPSGQAPAQDPAGVAVPEEIDVSPAAPLPEDSGSSGQTSSTRSGQPSQAPPAEVLFVGDETRARDHDGDGKPDGIEAGFVLLDTSGKVISGPARLVFSLMDDALPSGQQRLGLWEHNQDSNTSSGAVTATGETLRVFLPWQGAPPEHDELWLFVRLVGSSSTSEASTPVRLSAVISAPASSGRTADAGPEIEIELDDLAEPANGSQPRRPRWRATR
jgi:hypothetical protein